MVRYTRVCVVCVRVQRAWLQLVVALANGVESGCSVTTSFHRLREGCSMGGSFAMHARPASLASRFGQVSVTVGTYALAAGLPSAVSGPAARRQENGFRTPTKVSVGVWKLSFESTPYTKVLGFRSTIPSRICANFGATNSPGKFPYPSQRAKKVSVALGNTNVVLGSCTAASSVGFRS